MAETGHSSESIVSHQEFKQKVLQAAIAAGYLNDEQPLAAFVDVCGVKSTIQSLQKAFPDHFEHTFAAKANTMSQALKLVKDSGMGCEAASRGELEQALRVGFAPEKIVYDEPTKSRAVLRTILDHGIDLNIDNFQEFERLKTMRLDSSGGSRIGFRINPQVGEGAIGAMSTATLKSKFGVPLQDIGMHQRLFDCYLSHPWLTTIHTHIGSQGCKLELMAAGIRKVVDLAEEINSATRDQQIRVIDIGGGLPVNFESDEITPTFSEYADLLQEQIPELFSGKYTVKTEFGRSIFAKNGFMAARVEYTKNSGGRQIALTHAGVQVATRTVYMPDHWKIRISVHDDSGVRREGNEVCQDVAGPCCFAGDLVATERELPLIEPGDYVVLHDTGAYYFSNPYYYNSLQATAVYGAEWTESNLVSLNTWRKQQSLTELLSMLG